MGVDSGSNLRRTNRLRVIETLYRRPATSRSDLARLTGLSRATISTLVDELGRAGLVTEHPDGDGRPRNTGRPPPDYLSRWLAITGGLFAASAAVWAVRVARAAKRSRR